MEVSGIIGRAGRVGVLTEIVSWVGLEELRTSADAGVAVAKAAAIMVLVTMAAAK